MRVPWIRVHGDLIDRPVVTRLAHATGISDHEAVGVLVTFWSGVSKHVANGLVSNQPDDQLEKWAKWNLLRRKKRGAFAKWVREQHLDADGRVREWDEYAGKLEVIRERDRLRKSTGNPKEFQRNGEGIPPESLRNSTPARGNETRRDETKRENPKSKAVPDWLDEAVAYWSQHVGVIRPAKILSALTPLVDAHGWESVRLALEVYCSLDEGPQGARKPEWFAENFQRWRTTAETPLVDAGGVLTERGKRVMRSA